MNEPAIREVTDMTPAELGGEIRLLTQQARRMALSYAIQIGYRLKAAHEKVGPHGWAEWLKKETEFSAAAASRFEKLYEGYGTEQGSLFGVENKFPTLKNISVSNALRLLAVPEEERGEVAAELDAEHISARELEKALAERDEWKQAAVEAREEAMKEHEAAKELEYDLEKARRAGEETERKLKELESKPVEVAVERDEEAVRKAAEAAKKEAETAAQKEISDLKKKLKEAEKSAKTAEEERDLAKKGAGDIEPLKEAAKKAEAEAEALRKKLAAAETGAGEAALLARMAQENFAAAMDRIERMKDSDSATAEKLLTGMERIAQALLERIREAKNA